MPENDPHPLDKVLHGIKVSEDETRQAADAEATRKRIADAAQSPLPAKGKSQ